MASLEQILVADDDDMVRMVIRTVLAKQGYQIEEASSGQETIEKFSQNSHHPDLVMVDQNMPGMSGFETLAHLREMNPSIKAVLLSGGFFEEGGPEENSHTRYLTKPFVNEELIAVVKSLLSQHDAPRSDPGIN